LIAFSSLALVCSHASAGDFKGYPCTEDCSGHEAGYEWAERKDIDEESDCSGNSQSFIEGCQAYVEEQNEDEQSGARE
jgi:hypothetical protein